MAKSSEAGRPTVPELKGYRRLHDASRGMMLWTLLFWVFVGWAGFAVALGGVAKLQKDVADHPESLEWWCSPAAYPLLGVSQVFRFDWFVLALQFAVVAGILLLLFLEWLERARVAVASLLASAAVLQVISADRQYNVADLSGFQGARCAFAGYITAAIADFALVYILGVQDLEPTIVV